MDQSFDSLAGCNNSSDDLDDSLLVSPAPKQQQRSISSGRRFGGSNAANKRSGSSSSSSDQNESYLGDATPVKTKFNYASAMEELECLAPTPATNKKQQRRRGSALFVNASSSPGGGRLGSLFDGAQEEGIEEEEEVVEEFESPVVDEQAEESMEALDQPLFDARKTEDTDPSINSAGEVDPALEQTVAKASSSPSASPKRHSTTSSSPYFSNSNHSPPNSATTNNPFAAYAASSSVFRQQSNDNPNSSTEQHNINEGQEHSVMSLKRGSPVNESYDSVDYHHLSNKINSTTGADDDNEENGIVQGVDISMEVENAAMNEEGRGELLNGSSRVDNVDMDDVQLGIGSALATHNENDDKPEEEEDSQSFPDIHQSHAFEEDENEDEILSLARNDSLTNRPKFCQPLEEKETAADADDDDEVNTSRMSHISNRRSNRRTVNNRNVFQRSGFDHSALDITQDVSSLDDSMSSIDSDMEDGKIKERQSEEYVERMRESIASYFSGHSSGSKKNLQEGGNNPIDNVDTTKQGPSYLNNQAATFDTKEPSSYKQDISHETVQSYYAKEEEDSSEDNNQNMINMSALGSDVSQIDVDETLEYVGQVQSNQYEIFESDLGELNGIQQRQVGEVPSDEEVVDDECLDNGVDASTEALSEEPIPIDKSSVLEGKLKDGHLSCSHDDPIAEAGHSETNVNEDDDQDLQPAMAAGASRDAFAPEPPAETTFSSKHSEYPTVAAAANGNQSIEDELAPTGTATSIGLTEITKPSDEPVNGVQTAVAEGFCDVVVADSIECISSLHPESDDIVCRASPTATNSAKPKLAVKNEVASHQHASSEHRLEVDTSFEHNSTADVAQRDSFTGREAHLMGSSLMSEQLSPITKSSSPHNDVDDLLNNVNNSAQKYEVEKDSQEPSISDASSSDCIGTEASAVPDAKKKVSIFQVLSEPVQESFDGDSMKQSTDESYDQESPIEDENQPEVMCGKSVDSSEAEDVKPEVIKDNISETSTSPANAASAGDDFNSTPEMADRRYSLDDLSSHQHNFNNSSSAFLERVRGAAETRKREVLSGRYSMERKEQILSDEKKERAELPMSAVEEEMAEEVPKEAAIRSRPKKKIEGIDPFKPFAARPLPLTTTQRPKHRASAMHAPKTTKPASKRSTLAPGENPYRPFVARPLPGTTHSRASMSLGAKRKSSTAFKPHSAQNQSSIKCSALNAKPPKRLLSGEDASVAKEMSRRKRIQEEEARIRRESNFKARPLPSANLVRGQSSLVGVGLVPSKKVRSGKENSTTAFIPRSGTRAEERAAYDNEKTERELQQRQDQIDHRNQLIDQTSSEINDLKNFLR